MIVYDTGHINSASVCPSLADGFGWELKTRSQKPKGYFNPWPRPLRGPAAIYGHDRGTMAVKRQCEADGRDWFFADNGYIGASKYDGFYKISRNAFQCSGRGAPDEARLARLLDITGTRIEKWRKPTPSGYILVCPPITAYDKCLWFSTTEWIDGVSREIRKASKREIRLRHKPVPDAPKQPPPLAKHLAGAHALVTHDSNIVVEAILAGVPAFVTGKSPAAIFGNVDLATIEEPRRDLDRAEWLAILAADQWTLAEIRDGAANERLGIK